MSTPTPMTAAQRTPTVPWRAMMAGPTVMPGTAAPKAPAAENHAQNNHNEKNGDADSPADNPECSEHSPLYPCA